MGKRGRRSRRIKVERKDKVRERKGGGEKERGSKVRNRKRRREKNEKERKTQIDARSARKLQTSNIYPPPKKEK